jgi:hypothetical protein
VSGSRDRTAVPNAKTAEAYRAIYAGYLVRAARCE